MERRIYVAAVALVICFVGLTLAPPAAGQDIPQQKKKAAAKKKKAVAIDAPAADPSRPTFSAQVGLPANTEIEQKLHAIPEYMGVKAWKEVTRALQEILDGREDAFVPVTVEAGAAPRWVSARVEANRLLGTLPPEAREVYEVLSGGRAAGLLKEGREHNDPERLADVAQRFLHTTAGGEALDLLGTHHLDRGRYLMATLCFERLLARPEAPAPASLYKAALSCARSGNASRAADLFKRLEANAPTGLVVGTRKAGLDELQALLQAPLPRPEAAKAPADWLLFRGSAARLGISAAKPPPADAIQRAWQANGVEGVMGKGWLTNAITATHARGHAVLPGFAPIAVGDGVLYRTQQGVRALHAHTGELLWESVSLDNGFDSLADHVDKNISGSVNLWVGNYLSSYPNVLLENSVIGTLTSDGRRVFVVEDVAVPPYPNRYPTTINAVRLGGADSAPIGTKEIHHNRLLAINLESGKIDWMQGGPAQAEAQPLDDAIFLGPPLPLAGKLYALMEKESELRLVCLEPNRGEICWNQPLITYKKSVMHECGRRLWAAPLAYDQGILVCPSNSGAVVGVDLLTHSLVWAYSYVDAPAAAPMNPPVNAARLVARTTRAPAPPRLTATWKNSGPIIAGGKVIVSAPDAAALHCLNLRDGSLAWKIDRHPDDQYVAGVFADKVLIVGQSQCRAVSLTDGKQLWQTLSRLPAGQGVFADGQYYLPLRSGGDGPCIVALDMTDGKTVRRIDMPRHDGPGHTSERDVPGNLVFTQGRIVSQTPLGIAAYGAKE